MKNKSLKLILQSQYIHEVQIAKTKLESEKINSYLIDENIVSTIGTAFIDNYKLMVDISDFDMASSILSMSEN